MSYQKINQCAERTTTRIEDVLRNFKTSSQPIYFKHFSANAMERRILCEQRISSWAEMKREIAKSFSIVERRTFCLLFCPGVNESM